MFVCILLFATSASLLLRSICRREDPDIVNELETISKLRGPTGWYPVPMELIKTPTTKKQKLSDLDPAFINRVPLSFHALHRQVMDEIDQAEQS